MHLVKYRPRKYNNVKTDGYDSKLEASRAKELEVWRRGGLIDHWDAQERHEIRLNGELITTYKIDFVIYHNGKIHPKGVIEYIETKGYFDYASKLRWKMFVATFHDEILKGDVICTLEMQSNNYNYKKYKK